MIVSLLSFQIYPAIALRLCKGFETLDVKQVHLFGEIRIKALIWTTLHIHSASPI
jgi:hypothetical protein